MTSPRTARDRRLAPARRRTRGVREVGDAGQALPEYVGVVAVMVAIVAIVFASATPVGAEVARQLVCAVSPIVKEDGQVYCEGGDEVSGGDESGPDDGYSPPADDCEQDVTFDTVDTGLIQWETSVVQIGCTWYPVPTICFGAHMPSGFLDREDGERVYRADEIQDFVKCVTDGRGGPSEDPNDKSCATAVPTSGEFDEDAPPVVQVGCQEMPVPKGCEAEWQAYEDAAPGKERAGASGHLANCVADQYKSMTIPCVVEATGHVESNNVSFLFFRWGNSNGTLIEKLGDGRIRIHILRGVEQGVGLSGSGVGGSPLSFSVAGITGYSKDKTYEFTSMEKAQEWIDWFQKYNDVNGKPESCSGAMIQWTGGCGKNEYLEEAAELAHEEPEHHELAEAKTDIKKVTLNGGLNFEDTIGGKKGKGDKGGGNTISGSIEGGYEGEIQIEERLWSDGSQTVTYTSSDIGGFLIGAKLGGKKPFTKDKKGEQTSGGAGGGGNKVGAEWKGTTKTTVLWDKTGELSKLIIAMDEQVLQTLYNAGIDVEVALPYGFTIGGGYSKSEEDGTISTREMIIDFKQYPELREKLGPTIDEIFPRDDEDRLITDDVVINGNDSDGGELYEAAENYANVRELEYDASRITESNEAGLTWQGLDLFKSEWITVDEERMLSESSFEVTDVDGNKQTMSPAPQCRAKDFEPPEGYYSDDFSDPPTKFLDSQHDLGAEYYDNETPKYTDGTYPGTDYDGDVPGDRAERIHSLLDEYSDAFSDTNILVVKDFENFSFRAATGWEHLATVDGMDVIAIDSGTVKNKGDGGWINWGFTGNYDYDPDTKTVKFDR